MEKHRYMHPTLGEIHSFEPNLKLPKIDNKKSKWKEIYSKLAGTVVLSFSIISIWIPYA